MTTPTSAIITSLDSFLQVPEYDYIIVGGGTAGLVLAARLSEDPNVTVAVLEAGDARIGDPNIASPVGMATVLDNPEYDWCFRSTPQAGNNDKIHHVARGKCLGGSSSINFLTYCRPTREDIDRWEELGNEGWNWDNLLPYYRKCERIAQGSLPVQGAQDSFVLDEQFHGDETGVIGTSFPSWRFPFEDTLLKALDETAGLERPVDPWGGDHLGFYGTLSTIDRTGERPVRCNAVAGYLKLMEDRPNVKILTNALACRLILSEEVEGSFEPPTARGLVFSCQNHMHRVLAKKEVILSCGSIKSPQLLELSGIGDPAILEAVGIECRVPLPSVGRNLQEHPMTSVTYELTPENQTLDTLFADTALFGQYLQQYFTEGDGPVGGCMSLTGFIPYATLVSESRLEASLKLPTETEEAQNTLSLLRDETTPSLQITCVPANFSPETGYAHLNQAMPGAPAGRGPCYTILISNSYPLSRGSVHITASDPFTAPTIDLGILRHSLDVDVLAAGVLFADKVFQSAHVREKMVARVSPPASMNLDSWETVRTYAKDQALIFNHSLGTCAMGNGEGAVVDGCLRVRGVRGLRVVDASVIPSQLSGNIIATVYALAERAAELIQQ
ncbi:hypothetical protein BJX63DRAFT_433113 [Aspergillus granulosus]|uniref:Glucose-methanol-choline oxidoreductase N-terminal domain-containing protein n=1 Tax=Aspergillus granulosus TaxID=176169 RepID=A0ABR4H8H8_9EURO